MSPAREAVSSDNFFDSTGGFAQKDVDAADSEATPARDTTSSDDNFFDSAGGFAQKSNASNLGNYSAGGTAREAYEPLEFQGLDTNGDKTLSGY